MQQLIIQQVSKISIHLHYDLNFKPFKTYLGNITPQEQHQDYGNMQLDQYNLH